MRHARSIKHYYTCRFLHEMLFEAITISNKTDIMMTSLTQLEIGFGESSTDGVSQIEDVYEPMESTFAYIEPIDMRTLSRKTIGKPT